MTDGDAEKPFQRPVPSFWRWMGVCLLFVGPAILCLGEPFNVIAGAILFGWMPFVAQGVAWGITRAVDRLRPWQRYLCFVVPLLIAFWLLFEHSVFYGRPRWVIGEALKESAPLVFWPVEFSEDAWTDYTAHLRVHLDKDYLRNALEKHFERRQFLDGMPHEYYRKDLAGVEGTICIVETDAQFSYAKITYGVD
jgi:hypothetical protein